MKRQTIIPRIITLHVNEVADFVRKALGGTGESRSDQPTQITIGDCVLMVSDGGGIREPMPAFLYVYVPDTDAAFQRAVDLGATILETPSPQFYGDRRATVRDPWGNIWQIATQTGGGRE